MTILFAILAFLVGLTMCHYILVKPLEETDAKLRKELKTLRGELWAKTLECQNLRCWVMMDIPVFTPAGKNYSIPHRAHSDVLPFDSIDDLIEGTK